MFFVELIIGAILGGLIGWFTSHSYYNKGSKDQERLCNKLNKDLRKIILNANANKLGIKELNQLLERKSIDQNSSDPLPYTACPKCGNQKLKKNSYSDENTIAFFVSCPKCKWQEMS